MRLRVANYGLLNLQVFEIYFQKKLVEPEFMFCQFGFDHSYQDFLIRISYCSADATFDHVFAFIATNRDNTMECHAFLCPKVLIMMSLMMIMI